ncbi:MAG TPA: ribose 5-phosphate isomerase B [Flavisolibacter sp.]|jgi:ribose 5-phosphate isomerase B
MEQVFNLTKPVAIGADHAGFELKEVLIDLLKSKGLTVNDLGTYSADSVDYPDFAHPVAHAVESNQAGFGVLVCGSANGVAITANKHQGIRAALCWTAEIAALSRQHNNANVICIPSRFVSTTVAEEMLKAFLETPFEGGRHEGRVGKIACM